MKVTVTLNHEETELFCTENESLAEVLRRYGCKSLKIGCDDGVCGTCTVLLNGKPVPSCECLACRQDGAEILTVEGLGEEGEKIGRCLTEIGGEGCGYCAPAFVMMAYACKKELKNPSDEEIRAYISGNLCRCTGYAVRVEALRAYLEME